MALLETFKSSIIPIETILNYTFKDPRLLQSAFTHRSFINENKDLHCEHNERLEYLGDSVLGVLVSSYLYTNNPNLNEGTLSYLRSRIVNANSCMLFIQKLALENFLLLGKGEQMNVGRGKESILADLYEALIGSIFLDGGLSAARDFLFFHFEQDIIEIVTNPISNWKACLQDFSQKKFQETPYYDTLNEQGPDHNKTFKVGVYIKDKLIAEGVGKSKKEAQQAAAKRAGKKLKIQ